MTPYQKFQHTRISRIPTKRTGRGTFGNDVGNASKERVLQRSGIIRKTAMISAVDMGTDDRPVLNGEKLFDE